jgi:hypothetical protein
MHCVMWTHAVPRSSQNGIYLWASKADADRFYSPAWMAGVTERWGANPRRDDWIVPVVAETIAGVVVTDPAGTPTATP